MKKPATVNEYIRSFPASTRKQLEELRAIIRKAAPNAEEVISYGMPGYKQHSVLVYFAGYERHIGFYPTGTGIEAFKELLGAYTFSKGAVQFPLGKPLPKKLITEMVKFRLHLDTEIAAVKLAAKAAKKEAAKAAAQENKAAAGKKAPAKTPAKAVKAAPRTTRAKGR
ncbi:MAG: DUF1801 domain-containing protein [Bacteroidetes bacterium]|nr:DUF1801 domain-containing protein [Bacteroidota bacterium]